MFKFKAYLSNKLAEAFYKIEKYEDSCELEVQIIETIYYADKHDQYVFLNKKVERRIKKSGLGSIVYLVSANTSVLGSSWYAMDTEALEELNDNPSRRCAVIKRLMFTEMNKEVLLGEELLEELFGKMDDFHFLPISDLTGDQLESIAQVDRDDFELVELTDLEGGSFPALIKITPKIRAGYRGRWKDEEINACYDENDIVGMTIGEYVYEKEFLSQL